MLTACLLTELHWNFKVCCPHFFSKFELPNWGCGLSTGVAHTSTFTVSSWVCWRDDEEGRAGVFEEIETGGKVKVVESVGI